MMIAQCARKICLNAKWSDTHSVCGNNHPKCVLVMWYYLLKFLNKIVPIPFSGKYLANRYYHQLNVTRGCVIVKEWVTQNSLGIYN